MESWLPVVVVVIVVVVIVVVVPSRSCVDSPVPSENEGTSSGFADVDSQQNLINSIDNDKNNVALT